jgi:3-oxoacyl-[acyl-carrier-protein] synthase II
MDTNEHESHKSRAVFVFIRVDSWITSMHDCRISGLGLVTPLGLSVGQSWAALLSGAHIRDHSRVELGASETGLARVCRLGVMAAGEAVAEAGWGPEVLGDEGTALVVGTSKGAVVDFRSSIFDFRLEGHENPESSRKSQSANRRYPVGLSDIAEAVGEHFGINGPRMTVPAACASGLVALIRGAMMIRGGEARRVLVVAAEASVHPLFVGSFARLGVLPREGVGCRPFDRGREGFVMSEAAAAVCVELEDRKEKETRRHGDKERKTAASSLLVPLSPCRPVPSVSVEGFAMGGDAVHLTGGDAEGRVLRRMLGEVIDGRQVDLVHAHGTGTAFNDPVELGVIESVIGSEERQGDKETRRQGDESPRAVPLSPCPLVPLPHVYSHKGALGHSLGAAGLVSVVLNCMMHREGVVLPNVQTHMPLEMRGVRLNREVERREIRRSVALAAGFGGAAAVVGLVG